jgi:hypothetical protein
MRERLSVLDGAGHGLCTTPGEPRTQDGAGARGAGLSLTTIVGILLIAVPIIWAIVYLAQAGAAGPGGGFTLLVGVVAVACVAIGVLFVRGLFKT